MPPKKRANKAVLEAAESDVESVVSDDLLSSTPPKELQGIKKTINQTSSPEYDVEIEKIDEDDNQMNPAKKGETSAENEEQLLSTRKLPPRDAKTGTNMNEHKLAKNVIGDVVFKKKSTKPSAAKKEKENAPKKEKENAPKKEKENASKKEKENAPKKTDPKLKKSDSSKKNLNSPKKKASKIKNTKKTENQSDSAEEDDDLSASENNN